MTAQRTDTGVWGVRGLRGLSGLMAVFCGLAATVLGVVAIAMVATVAIAAATDKPVHWNASSKAAAIRGDSDMYRKCLSQRGTTCAKPSVREIAPATVGTAASLLPMAALVYGLSQACLCFVGMARGRFLHRQTASRLMRFATGGLLFVLFSPLSATISRTAMGLTYQLIDVATGQKTIVLLSGYDATVSGVSGPLTAIYAITLTVIAVVMVKASTIADDHAQIV